MSHKSISITMIQMPLQWQLEERIDVMVFPIGMLASSIFC